MQEETNIGRSAATSYKIPLAQLEKLKVPNHRDVGSIPVESIFFFLNVYSLDILSNIIQILHFCLEVLNVYIALKRAV
jgi:hypothetical protein